jgi:hypothetical protein
LFVANDYEFESERNIKSITSSQKSSESKTFNFPISTNQNKSTSNDNL